MSKRSCIFITVTMQIRTFSLNLGTSNKNFGTTRYFRERSWWIRITPIKFFRNFSKKYCVLMLMKLSTKEVIYILKSYAYLEHLVKIMFTLNQPMETKAIISNILFVLIVINNSWNFFLLYCVWPWLALLLSGLISFIYCVVSRSRNTDQPIDMKGQILSFVDLELPVITEVTGHFFWTTGKDFIRVTSKALEIVQTTLKQMPHYFTDDDLVTT